MKPVKEFRITNHGVEHAQYFQGHGVTDYGRWDGCATGAGETFEEAFDDAVDSLAQNDWDTTKIDTSATTREELAAYEYRAAHDDCEPDSRQGHEECELHWYVSIDVKGEG